MISIGIPSFASYIFPKMLAYIAGAIFCNQNVFKYTFPWKNIIVFRYKFYGSLLIITICQQRFCWWLGVEKATSPYLNETTLPQFVYLVDDGCDVVVSWTQDLCSQLPCPHQELDSFRRVLLQVPDRRLPQKALAQLRKVMELGTRLSATTKS